MSIMLIEWKKAECCRTNLCAVNVVCLTESTAVAVNGTHVSNTLHRKHKIMEYHLLIVLIPFHHIQYIYV